MDEKKVIEESQRFINLAIKEIDIGKYDSALIILNSALELTPKNPVIFGLLGMAKYEKNRLKEAANFYEKALVLDQTYSFAWHGLGKISKALRDFKQAILYFEEALRYNKMLSRR